MENDGVLQSRRRNPKRKPLSVISNNEKSKLNSKPGGSETRIARPSLREFGSCSDAGLVGSDLPYSMKLKSKSNPKSNPNQNADRSCNDNTSNSNLATCSDSNLASCSTPAPNNPQSILNLGEKSTEIKQLTTYKIRRTRTNQLEINTESRETGTSETQILTKSRKTGTSESQTLTKSRKTGTSETETLTKKGKTGTSETETLTKKGKTGTSETEIVTKNRKTGTSETEIVTKNRKTGTSETEIVTKKGKTHLTGASSCPPVQKNVQKKKGEKSTKREKRLVVSSAPAKKRQEMIEWPEDFVEKQRAYFAEIDAEELLEETDSD